MAVEGCVGNQQSVRFFQKDNSRTGQTEEVMLGVSLDEMSDEDLAAHPDFDDDRYIAFFEDFDYWARWRADLERSYGRV